MQEGKRMQISLVISNRMPLCFRNSRSDASVDTLNYISGTALLGGLAAAHCRLNRSKTEFAQFFTSGKIRFNNLYPANFMSDFLKGDSLPVRPLPATARSCKYFSGFIFNADREDEERHGVSDYLIPWALFALNPRKSLSILKKGENCYACDKPVTSFPGFYRHVSNTNHNSIGISKVSTRVITRTGISRQRGAVSEEILYNREVLVENQTFWGTLYCENKTLWDDFELFIKEASDDELIYLGNNRSRGLGQVNLKSDPVVMPEETPNQLKQRVINFSGKLKETARSIDGLAVPDSLYIPITLKSALILRDSYLRYKTTIDESYFQNEWGLSGMVPVYQSLSTRRIMGWNAMLGLPKADDIAIEKGSVFLFSYNGDAKDPFWQTLTDIQKNGIGERRQEGFGEITIAEPFHTEVNPL